MKIMETSVMDSCGSTMTSREIADITGKNHFHVVRDIEVMVKALSSENPNQDDDDLKGIFCERSVYNGRDVVSLYRLDREMTLTLVTGYDIALRRAVVSRWHELESRQAKPVLPDFSNPVAAARAWADAEEKRMVVSKQLEEAKPKVDFVDNYVTSGTGNKTFRQVAKLLEANETAFREFLKDEKIMYRLNGEYVAHKPHLDAGRFEVKTDIARNGHVFTQTKFTPKGFNWIAGIWANRDTSGK